jgi:hypothetical protein
MKVEFEFETHFQLSIFFLAPEQDFLRTRGTVPQAGLQLEDQEPRGSENVQQRL